MSTMPNNAIGPITAEMVNTVIMSKETQLDSFISDDLTAVRMAENNFRLSVLIHTDKNGFASIEIYRRKRFKEHPIAMQNMIKSGENVLNQRELILSAYAPSWDKLIPLIRNKSQEMYFSKDLNLTVKGRVNGILTAIEHVRQLQKEMHVEKEKEKEKTSLPPEKSLHGFIRQVCKQKDATILQAETIMRKFKRGKSSGGKKKEKSEENPAKKGRSPFSRKGGCSTPSSPCNSAA